MKGTCLASLLTATGASMCYFLSLLTGSEFILNTWPEKMSHFRAQVKVISFNLSQFMKICIDYPISYAD